MTPQDDFTLLYQRAQDAAKARDLERARALLRAAVALAPDEKRGWLALAQLEDNPQAKTEAYRRVLALDPRDAVARAYLQGRQDARQDEPTQDARRRIPPLWWLIPLVLLLALGGYALLSAPTPAAGDLPTSAPGLTASPGAAQAEGGTPVDARLQALSLPTDELPAHTATVTLTPGASSSPASLLLPDVTASAAGLPTLVLPPGSPSAANLVGPPTQVPLLVPTLAQGLPTSAPALVLPSGGGGSAPSPTVALALPSATSAPPTAEGFVPLPTSTSIPPFIVPTFERLPTEVIQPPAPLPDFPTDPFSGGQLIGP